MHAHLKATKSQRSLRDERFNLENLRGLLHDNGVKLQLEVGELVSLDCGVCTRHCDHFGVLRKKVVPTILAASQHFKGPSLLQLLEDALQMPKGRLGNLKVFVERFLLQTTNGSAEKPTVTTLSCPSPRKTAD